jgi:hypothetical protein
MAGTVLDNGGSMEETRTHLGSIGNGRSRGYYPVFSTQRRVQVITCFDESA